MQQGGDAPEPSIAALARDAITQGLAALAAPSTAHDTMSGLRWLQRAHRLLPFDPNVTLTLASAYLTHDAARAAMLFRGIADKYDVRQAWLGLAAARLQLTDPDGAAESLAVVLSRYAFTPDVVALANAITRRYGYAGWCALRSDGSLQIDTAPLTSASASTGLQVCLDGKPVCSTTLPPDWQRGRTIDIRIGDTALLGSPIQIQAIRRLAGCVEAWDGGIRGWAWHPGDPDTPPALTLLDASLHPAQHIVARHEITVADTGPLARPRAFHLTWAELPEKPGPLRIIGSDGTDLLGSPLNPFLIKAVVPAEVPRFGQIDHPAEQERPKNWIAADAPLICDPLPRRNQAVDTDDRPRAISVVIPVHNGGSIVLACLDSVVASTPAAARILVVDDGSSDLDLVAKLDDLALQRKITLLRHVQAKGFPTAANAGIQAAQEHDVVLLNSDTLVPPGWLNRLQAAAYVARDIGTVTPFSNDASILSYPGPSGTNPQPDQATTTQLDRAAFRANGSSVTNIPVGVGFCLYLRRDCLNGVGLFRADLFAQGYGEEDDFCLRAHRLGWRNVALTGLFVGHHGSTSFASSSAALRTRNGHIIDKLHPGYQALIQDYRARDPLAEPRRRIDIHRWRQRGRKWRQSAILVTHDSGGGVQQRLIHAIALHKQAGRRPIVLRPAETAAGVPAIAVRDATADDLPNLIFAMPHELPPLLRLLRATRPEVIEAHHLADHPPAIYDLLTRLNVPYDVHVHDYAWFCPRISLVGTQNRYCGEPDLPDCEACVADHGHFLKENITVAALRHRSATFLSAAERVVVPSDDTGKRIRRHFAGLTTITIPHEDDASIPTPPHIAAPSLLIRRHRTSVCVVGGIGVHKGYDILLACAKDAVRRNLDLEFVVVGHTIDDAPMLATGRVFVTGRFEPDEVVVLISEQNCQLGFVTSICPETWCLSLGDIWRAGLQAAAFDIGAPAERIRSTRRGILLPLGLSAGAINNVLIASTQMTAQQ